MKFRRMPILPLPYGISSHRHPFLSEGAIKVENWWISPNEFGALEVIPGASDALGTGEIGGGSFTIMSLGYGESKDEDRWVYATGSTKVWSINSAGTVAELKTGLTAGQKFSIVNYGNRAHFFNGTDTSFQHTDYTTVEDISPGTAPNVSGTASVGNGVGPLTGGYYWWVTFETTTTGGAVSEGPLSERIPDNDTGHLGQKYKIRLTGVPVFPTPVTGYSYRRLIYRSMSGGSDPFLCGTIDDNTTTTFDGSIADTELGSPPSRAGGEPPPAGLHYVCVYNNRLYGAGDPNAPSNVYYSGLGDPADWNSTYWYLSIAQNDGDKVTGVHPTPAGLLVTKKHHMYLAMGQDPEAEWFNIRPLTPSNQRSMVVGCPSHWACAGTPSGHFFYYNKAFYVVSPSGNIARVSTGKIEDDLRQNINTAKEHTIETVYYPEYDIVLCSVPTGSSDFPNVTYVWYRSLNSFTKITAGFPAMTLVERGTNGSPATSVELWASRYVSVGETSKILKLFDTSAYTIDGTTITATLELSPIMYASPSRTMLWTKALLTAKEETTATTLTFKYGVEGDTTRTSATVNLVDDSSNTTRVTRDIGITENGRDLDVEIVSANTQTRPVIYALEIFAVDRGLHQDLP